MRNSDNFFKGEIQKVITQMREEMKRMFDNFKPPTQPLNLDVSPTLPQQAKGAPPATNKPGTISGGGPPSKADEVEIRKLVTQQISRL